MRWTKHLALLMLIAAPACGGDRQDTDGTATDHPADSSGSSTHSSGGSTQGGATSTTDGTSSPTTGGTSTGVSDGSGDVALDLPAQQECAGYDVVLDDVFLDDNEDVLAIQGVECVRGSILVRLNVTDLTPLASLRATGFLKFEAPLLASLAGLEQLTEVRHELVLGAYLPDNGCVGTQVPTLAPLVSLEHVGALHVCDNQSLTSIVELDAALTGDIPGKITVASSPSLVSLSGFEGLTSVGLQLELTGLPLVESLQPLADVTRVDGAFTLAGLNSVTTMEGLEALNYAESLLIVENAGLVSLAGLDNVLVVGDNLSIRDNPMLPQAEAEAWAQQVDVGGTVTICGNLDGPSC